MIKKIIFNLLICVFMAQGVCFAEEAKVNSRPIVFFGDSLTAGGNWQQFFPGYKVANRGIPGNTSTQMLARVKTDVINENPEKVYMLCGANDLAHKVSPKDIVANVKKLAEEIKAECPDTKIAIESCLPINRDIRKIPFTNQQVRELNVLLKEMCADRGLEFLDLTACFAKDGSMNKQLTTDGLHLNEQGYEKWVAKLYEKDFVTAAAVVVAKD